MQIIFPTDFMLKEGPCTVTQQSTNYFCSISTESRTITITNLPATQIPSNQNWSFTVSGIRNPGKFSGIGDLTLKTLKSDANVLDVGIYKWPLGVFGASTV
jgi:hypothetical protein